MENLSIDEAANWYLDADPVHNFDHVLRVYRIAEHIALAEGADLQIVRTAALLHDVCGSAPGAKGNTRAEHHIASAAFAGQVLGEKGWPLEKIKAVQHCIRGHRFRGGEDRPETLEAQVIFDADKLDVLGAIGAARTVAYAALENQPIFSEPSQKFLEIGQKEPNEPHSSYHEFLFKLRKVKDRMFTKTGKALAEARHAFLLDFYAQLGAEVRGER